MLSPGWVSLETSFCVCHPMHLASLNLSGLVPGPTLWALWSPCWNHNSRILTVLGTSPVELNCHLLGFLHWLTLLNCHPHSGLALVVTFPFSAGSSPLVTWILDLLVCYPVAKPQDMLDTTWHIFMMLFACPTLFPSGACVFYIVGFCFKFSFLRVTALLTHHWS